jgi:predicted ester cyclase
MRGGSDGGDRSAKTLFAPAAEAAGLGAGMAFDVCDRVDARDPESVVRRLIDEVLNGGQLEVIDELYTPEMARGARRWIAPFLGSFPDAEMEIVDLIAEGEKVVGRFRCSGTHLGPWRGRPPTGRRFERVDEVYIFRVKNGRISEAWGIEDVRSRERQLGLSR